MYVISLKDSYICSTKKYGVLKRLPWITLPILLSLEPYSSQDTTKNLSILDEMKQVPTKHFLKIQILAYFILGVVEPSASDSIWWPKHIPKIFIDFRDKNYDSQ